MTTSIAFISGLRFQFERRRTGAHLRFAAALLLMLQSIAWAQAPAPNGAPMDPPGRVARLNLIEGGVSFTPADVAGFAYASAWTPAELNRPLTTGDRLWTGPRARSEVHIGSTAVRMTEQTSLDFLMLDDNVTQLRLAQGSIKLRVRSLFEGQRLEVNTPNLAFVISQPGDYRVDANAASATTRVVAQSGSGVLYGDSGTALNLNSQQQGSFTNTDLTPAAPGASMQDGFDAWAMSRDRREDHSLSARYVPRETVGYLQLDSYGDWSQDPSYGAIWRPHAVPSNWAPYRVGHWSWIAPWGWTWIDDAPWGFAPFHYGRWAQIGPSWAWVPGRLAPRPVYAPALVAFVGGTSGGVDWNISIGSGGPRQPSLGWFPLAPGEAFRPGYRVSPHYVSQVNNNIVVNNTVTNNVTNIYRYQRLPAAVTAVSAADFGRGQAVRGKLHAPSARDLSSAQVVTDRSPLPQRPDMRELPRPALAAALPPAAVLAVKPVMGNRDERRDTRSDEHLQNRGGKPQAQSPLPVVPTAPAAPQRSPLMALPVPPATAGLPGTPPAVKPASALAATPSADRRPPATPQDRSMIGAENRAQRAQQLERDQQRQQVELNRQKEQHKRRSDELSGQRAMQEQAQRQQALQQQHRAQQDQQRKDEVALHQRALREQAQRQQPEQRKQKVEQKQPARQAGIAPVSEPRAEGKAFHKEQ